MKYEEVVRYIEDIPKFTKKHTLLHTREFMRRLGNPCQGRKVLHVAGTNGKGSVCAYMQAILLFEGKRVGFFTSPHLVKLNERIRINGKDIDDDTFCRIFAKVRQVAEELEKEGLEHPSYLNSCMEWVCLHLKRMMQSILYWRQDLEGGWMRLIPSSIRS